MSALGALFYGAIQAVRDARDFGPESLLHYFSAPLSKSSYALDVHGVGRLHLRPRSSDIWIAREIFGRKEYDVSHLPHAEILRAKYRQALAEGHTPLIIDAGANIGLAAVWFSKIFPEAKIVSVEPDPANAEMCRANTAHLKNVEVVEAAIGATPGRVALEDPKHAAAAIRTVRQEAAGVPVTTIQDICAARPAARLFMVKVDIEGFESDLFAANTDWLDDIEALYVEPHDWMLARQYSSRALQQALAPRGFEMIILGENILYVR